MVHLKIFLGPIQINYLIIKPQPARSKIKRETNFGHNKESTGNNKQHTKSSKEQYRHRAVPVLVLPYDPSQYKKLR
jgi:hypothetical protein